MRFTNPTDGEMPFLDHLEELRWRIIYGLTAVLVCVAFGFWLTLKFDVVGMIAGPVVKLLPQHALYFTHPSDKVAITMNVAFTCGLILAAPVIVLQAWLFLAPALRPTEKRVVLGVLYAGVCLFAAGAALAFFVVLSLALPWMLDFGSASLLPLLTAEDYFAFVIALVLTFGVSFELPIVILALSALGIVTPRLLVAYRRHAFVLIVFIAAFLTPGDLYWTTIALSVPLYLLYELSVLASYMVTRKRSGDEPPPLAAAALIALLLPKRDPTTVHA